MSNAGGTGLGLPYVDSRALYGLKLLPPSTKPPQASAALIGAMISEDVVEIAKALHAETHHGTPI
jgi:hypothetical protein